MALVTADLGTLLAEPYVLTGDHVITSGPRRPSQAAVEGVEHEADLQSMARAEPDAGRRRIPPNSYMYDSPW